MKIILVNPPAKNCDHPPLGIAYIAAMLEKEGYDTEIIDMTPMGTSTDDFRNHVEKKSPDAIGVTAVTSVAHKGLAVMKAVKEVSPNTLTVMGGPYACDFKEDVLRQNSFVDAVVIGEGEYTMLELVEHLESDKNFSSVQGLIYRENGRIRSNAPRAMIKDLDSLPYPIRRFYPKEKYSRFGTILTSRGCPFRCVFCDKSVIPPSFRPRSSANVVDEIEYLVKEYDIKTLDILDDLFSFDKERAKKICDEIISRGINLKIYCSNGLRVNSVDSELLTKMKEAGWCGIYYGIESGNQEILNNMRKGILVEQAKEAIEMTKQAGIEVGGYFMVGNPGENFETVKDTIKFIKESKLDRANINLAIPFYGTDLWKWVEKHGTFLIKDYADYDLHNVQSSPFETPDFTNEERIKAYRWAMKQKNKIMLFRAIKRNTPRIFQIRSTKDFKRKARIFFNLIKGSIIADTSTE